MCAARALCQVVGAWAAVGLLAVVAAEEQNRWFFLRSPGDIGFRCFVFLLWYYGRHMWTAQPVRSLDYAWVQCTLNVFGKVSALFLQASSESIQALL